MNPLDAASMPLDVDAASRRFIDRVVVLARADDPDQFRAHQHALTTVLDYMPEDASLELRAPRADHSRGAMWRMLGTDGTCRAIRTTSFGRTDVASKDIAAVAQFVDELVIVDVVDRTSRSRSWWAERNGAVVLVSGRRWSYGNLRDSHNHGVSTIRRLRSAVVHPWRIPREKRAEP